VYPVGSKAAFIREKVDIVALLTSNRTYLDPRPHLQANLVLRLVSGSRKSCATGMVVPNVTRSPQLAAKSTGSPELRVKSRHADVIPRRASLTQAALRLCCNELGHLWEAEWMLVGSWWLAVLSTRLCLATSTVTIQSKGSPLPSCRS
jgi:hypothetical protein